MKKTYFAVIVAATLLSSACSNTGNTSAVFPSNPDKFLSTDLLMSDLRGDVKTSTLSRTDADEQFTPKSGKEANLVTQNFAFTPDGMMMVFYNYNVEHRLGDRVIPASACAEGMVIPHITRDADNRVARMECRPINEEDDFLAHSYEYTWQNDKVSNEFYQGWEWNNESRFTYDDNCLLTEKKETWSEPEFKSESNSRYEYTEFDSHGNWTNRHVTSTTQAYEWNLKSEKYVPQGEPMTIYQVEIRKIIYY